MLNQLYPPQRSKKPSVSAETSVEEHTESEKERQRSAIITANEIPFRNFNKEFRSLNRASKSSVDKSKFVQCTSEISQRNRYHNVLPFVDSMVSLDDSITVKPEAYINANFVHNVETSQSESTFIATQGPLQKTSDDFWRMVLKYKSPLVIAIIEPKYIGDRCHGYWPIREFPQTELPEHKISRQEFWHSSLLNIQALDIFCKQKKTHTAVNHVHVHSWKDGARISRRHYVEFVELLKYIHAYMQDNQGSPIIVHCSAGVGRTCTLIAAYYLYESWLRCREQGKAFEFSIYGLVKCLRTQRWKAVQTLDQYIFLYEIIEFFD
jgi:protein tyrosine phosphatase